MSLLDQLWDDTIAGPRPDKGLGKLRKQPTFTLRALSSGKESDGGSVEEGVRVTRSIMIVKPPGVTQNDSPPVSPAGSTTPVSPFSDPVPIPALIVDGDIQVEERLTDFGGGLYRTFTRKQTGPDPEALLLLLLMACDI